MAKTGPAQQHAQLPAADVVPRRPVELAIVDLNHTFWDWMTQSTAAPPAVLDALAADRVDSEGERVSEVGRVEARMRAATISAPTIPSRSIHTRCVSTESITRLRVHQIVPRALSKPS